ncbi:piggyBac transposable element-derived protein 4-like isoform X1 [Sardina pilchardus]|uniref:piggyBac transposable element-derived protein 4-like isoform X1 n=1 Tax=Sardina pilchardus TaxID=27697 RepID=UPI002E106CD2
MDLPLPSSCADTPPVVPRVMKEEDLSDEEHGYMIPFQDDYCTESNIAYSETQQTTAEKQGYMISFQDEENAELPCKTETDYLGSVSGHPDITQQNGQNGQNDELNLRRKRRLHHQCAPCGKASSRFSNLKKRRRYTPRQALDLLWNIDEMESEGEPCEVSDGDDEREDEGEFNLNLESDSDSESDSEIDYGGSFQETARDGTVWAEQTAGSIRGRARECNIMTETPGPTDYAKDNVRSPLSSLLCLIDTEMWETIRKYTQAEADRNNADQFTLTADELKAFVGLIYLRGITGGKRMNLDDYWSADLGNAIFKETMSRQKFRDIMRYLRFDDKNTRSARLVADKFAMISEIFDKFVRNSIASYTPGENITVDEQLFPTKARCRFTQYMANKPDKFGIKFWVAADSQTKYMLNAFPYLGKDESRPAGEGLSENVVMRLMEPFLGKGRNVTTDHFFTSLALAKNLLVHETTILGTMKKIRREMPPCTQAQSERYSTKVLKAGNATLTIYQAKPKKNVCILSTMHPTVSIDNGAKKRPNTISHYNSTKVGVDVMDQMARLYSVKGGTRRWPVAVFYNLLDLAAINAHILYKQCMNVSIIRRKFILELVKELCANQKMAKAAGAASRKRLLPETPSPPAKRRQCQVGRCWNKTFEICQTCKRHVCGKCTKTAPRLCFECC